MGQVKPLALKEGPLGFCGRDRSLYLNGILVPIQHRSVRNVSAPKPLARRYSTKFSVLLRCEGWQEYQPFDATDLSRGGIFIATAYSPEIFTEADIRIQLPEEGQFLALSTRIVHLIPEAKAAEIGIAAGFGLQFDSLSRGQIQDVDDRVEWAKLNDPKRCVPAVTDAKGSIDDLMLVYVLTGIDGTRCVEAIAEALAMDLKVVDRMLTELARRGLVDWVWPVQRSTAGSRNTLQPGSAESPSSDVPARDAEQLREVTAFLKMSETDHYSVLGVAADATKKAIREAYFAGVSRFHPERAVGKTAGGIQQKHSAAFTRISEAYATLSHAHTRSQYDEYLRRVGKIGRPTQPVAKPSRPRRREPSGVRGPPRQINRRGRHSATPIQGKKKTGSDPPQSLDLVRTYLERATKAHADGNAAEAAQSLSLLDALDWNRPELREHYERLSREIAVELAPTYEKQALYEQKQQKWDKAAKSWKRVCLGRPRIAACHRQVAEAILAAGGDLHDAGKYASHAAKLEPTEPQNRRTLGHVYLKAGLGLNARRELEAAVKLSRDSNESAELLEELWSTAG